MLFCVIFKIVSHLYDAVPLASPGNLPAGNNPVVNTNVLSVCSYVSSWELCPSLVNRSHKMRPSVMCHFYGCIFHPQRLCPSDRCHLKICVYLSRTRHLQAENKIHNEHLRMYWYVVLVLIRPGMHKSQSYQNTLLNRIKKNKPKTECIKSIEIYIYICVYVCKYTRLFSSSIHKSQSYQNTLLNRIKKNKPKTESIKSIEIYIYICVYVCKYTHLFPSSIHKSQS